jgi:hypothetical protein
LERREDGAQSHHRVVEGEGAPLGIEAVGFEKVNGIPRQLMRGPGERPGVEQRIDMVGGCGPKITDQRIGEDHRSREEQSEDQRLAKFLPDVAHR